MRVRQLSMSVWTFTLLAFWAPPAWAGDRGSLIVRVNPAETYIYADGEPVIESKGHYITLPEGEHKIGLYNYGYKPESRSVSITAGKTTVIDVSMQAIPGVASGPWGCLTIEGPRGAAVLLNGKDPEGFFVGHVDEFNNEWIWHQELLVPPGKHEVTIAAPLHDSWTTSVEVQADQRVVIEAYKGVVKTVNWSRGQQLKEVPPFHTGIASAWVAVEKVTGAFSASQGQIHCGESARLTWSSSGASKTELNDMAVTAAGDQTVQPKQSTTYKFIAVGPGGTYTSDATVNVDSAIVASLSVSPSEVSSSGTGTNPPNSATLTWSASNADSVNLDPLGSVGTNGQREIPIVPAKASVGPDGKTITYTLHASNACGGSETRTAALHVKGGVMEGSADESSLKTKLSFSSIYFPTDLPSVKDPQGGVVPSQERRMEEIVSNLKQFLTLHPDVNLILEGHADERGSAEYNQALSQRRAERVENYLAAQGIPAGRMEVRAYGKAKNLTKKQVEELTAGNPSVSAEERQRVKRHMVVFYWANNRRVDVRLSTGVASQPLFPYDSKDLNVLVGGNDPGAKQTASLK